MYEADFFDRQAEKEERILNAKKTLKSLEVRKTASTQTMSYFRNRIDRSPSPPYEGPRRRSPSPQPGTSSQRRAMLHKPRGKWPLAQEPTTRNRAGRSPSPRAPWGYDKPTGRPLVQEHIDYTFYRPASSSPSPERQIESHYGRRFEYQEQSPQEEESLVEFDPEFPPQPPPLKVPGSPDPEKLKSELKIFAVHMRHTKVIVPRKATKAAAGLDIFMSSNEKLLPGVNKFRLPYGISLPKGTYAQIKERSSAALLNITVSGGVIDEDFAPTNDLYLILNNGNSEEIILKRGQAVAQLIILQLAQFETKYYIDKDFQIKGKPEGRRGFGSTGNVPKITSGKGHSAMKGKSKAKRNWKIPPQLSHLDSESDHELPTAEILEEEEANVKSNAQSTSAPAKAKRNHKKSVYERLG